MSLKKDFFLAKMLTINPSEDTLKALAIYLKIYEEEYRTIVEGFKYVYGKSSIHYKIILCLLIDRIIDLEIDSKMKEEFRIFVDGTFMRDDSVLNESHGYFKEKIDGLMKSWDERGFVKQPIK